DDAPQLESRTQRPHWRGPERTIVPEHPNPPDTLDRSIDERLSQVAPARFNRDKGTVACPRSHPPDMLGTPKNRHSCFRSAWAHIRRRLVWHHYRVHHV